MRRFLLSFWTLCALTFAPAALAQELPARVFAAASLTDALDALGRAYAGAGGPQPVFVFASSAALARQIEQGAGADLFLSADEPWMDYLAQRARIAPESRVSLLANRLVLIAPADRVFALAIAPGFALAGSLRGGRLAMADPDSVPAGRYGRAALEKLGVWESVAGKVARAENVRAALRFVEIGEAAAGIVYRTDALASTRVVVVGEFPADSHPAISYPMAVVRGGREAQARRFAEFLQTSEAKAVFARFGFLAR